MEGIMMRGPDKIVMCVRRMDGSIVTEDVKAGKTTIWNKIPIIRGVVSFIQSMSIGTKTLMRSAEIAIEDEIKAADEEAAAEAAKNTEQAVTEAAETAEVIETAESIEAAEQPTEQSTEAIDSAAAETVENVETVAETVAEQPTAESVEMTETVEEAEVEETEKTESIAEATEKAVEKQPEKKQSKKKKKNEKKDKGSDAFDSGPLMLLSTLLGFGMAILLFYYAPTFAANGLLNWVVPRTMPEHIVTYFEQESARQLWIPIIEGVVKIIILVIYMLICSSMKEIKTLFRYHGAEHKTIFCYEAGEELTVENVRKYKRFHPRCGTSFLILMMLVGIVAGMAAKYFLPASVANSNIFYPLIKLALIPLIMGIGYELLKLCGKHDNILTKLIAAPGLLMQRITTKEPTDEQIECAIAALIPVIPEDGKDMM